MQIKPYLHLLRLHKPIGIFLLLWPTLWALWLASAGRPNSKILIIFILGVIVTRSAGCIINDIADRNIDKHVARTADRPLTCGTVTLLAAFIWLFSLSLIALGLALLLNHFTLLLALIGALVAAIYPFLKRVTHLPQVGLGIAFAWSVPMAFAAIHNTLTPATWLVFSATSVWVIMYDTLYALADRADDLKIGVKSTAILWAKYERLSIALLQSIFLLLLLSIGYIFQLKIIYFVSLCGVLLLFFYQHRLISKKQPAYYLQAFLNNNWVGGVIFFGIVCG